MTLLAPWAFGIAALAALGTVLLHLVAQQRPAAFFLPTARFIPDRRTLVSRVTTRPRDLLLLLLRVLVLLAAGVAFARPVLAPGRGVTAHVVLLDRSALVADAGDAIARARRFVHADASSIIVAFDTTATVVGAASLDSLSRAPLARGEGSVSAALAAARRAGASIARHADSVQLVLVSPIAASELDSATATARRAWPGALRVERLALRADSAVAWRVEGPVGIDDPLGPSLARQQHPSARARTRLVRAPFSGADSAFARDGGTVVRWDSATSVRPTASGLLANGEVIVASLGHSALALRGRAVAHWADGEPAAVEVVLGTGCLREVGAALPAGGDLPLHPPFQRMVRAMLAPCGGRAVQRSADSATVAQLAGPASAIAAARDLRDDTGAWSSLSRWLFALALALAVAELLVRSTVIPSEQRESRDPHLETP